MALNSPFELEDMTGEDFFDKLVDDDDNVNVGVESSLKGDTGLVEKLETSDLVDGIESDEVKAFANLSINEVDLRNVDPKLKEVGASDGNCSGLESVEANEELVVDGEADNEIVLLGMGLRLSPSVGGQAIVEGVEGSEGKTDLVEDGGGLPSSGVKEINWSAFADSANHCSGAFGVHDDFLTDLGQGKVENVQSEDSGMFENETIGNAAMESVYCHSEEIAQGVDTISAEYYENQYPGWNFDPSTGQWYQLDTTLVTAGGNVEANFAAGADNSSQNLYSQQTTQTTGGTVSQASTDSTENVSDWNHSSQQNGGYQYPAHMVFDPQYPDWYYDTLAQEWRSLATYHSSIQSTELIHNQPSQEGSSGSTYSHGGKDQESRDINNNGLKVYDGDGLNANQNYTTSVGNYYQQSSNHWQSEFGVNGEFALNYGTSQSWPSYDSNVYSHTDMSPQKFLNSMGNVTSDDKTNQNSDGANWAGTAGNALQSFSYTPQPNGVTQYSTEFHNTQNAAKIAQPLFPNGHHVSHAASETRSLTGRPPHALVTFGFGGKLLLMKDTSTAGFSLHGSKSSEGPSLSVLNLVEVVGASCSSSYFQSLCHQSFPGPLVGGNAGNKELNRWIDERIANSESMSNDGNSEAPKLLLSLLKIACQHYGKFRSFGANAEMKDSDLPESAVASLFASANRKNDHSSQYNETSKCLMTSPSDTQIQETASEVQNLLISGRKRQALQRAQEGQYWEFALILARELGDQFYADTVKQMAVSQLVSGSPLRTLCLLIAKKPEEVFSNNVMLAGILPGEVALSQQPEQQYVKQSSGYSMLANWEENLAVITANRTENDHLVITHLGDSLWKERNDVTAAHICYLISEADFESYSETSRLCLIGADHWHFPRTYASPDALQITELFEYAKVTGNSQFVLLPLQPYKLIYAHMLAEVGRVSDSLRYCQAISKVLKTTRSPQVDMLKQFLSSLEERIRVYQQSGYAANLAPAKIVGKLLNLFDTTAHRVVGGLPPPVPSSSLNNGNHHQMPGSEVRSSQSTMNMSSLMPSASTEPINQWAGNGSEMTIRNRSMSESDIGRTSRPDQGDASNEATSSSADSKSSGSTKTSRFGRFNFGANIFQKTVGLVLKPRQGHQAKLGDTNKFYYDEKLKRWVEEGAEVPAEEPALAPPPTNAAFQAEKSNYYSNNAFKNGLSTSGGRPGLSTSGGSPEPTGSTSPGSNFGIPATPPSSNQFSAHSRMGVRSRYVDTFNKGGGASTNMFQAPSVSSAQPTSRSSANFFIPTATSASQPTFGTESGNTNAVFESEGHKSPIPLNSLFKNPAPSPSGGIQRFPSLDNISRGEIRKGNSSAVPHSRRTASWGGIHSDVYSSPPTPEVNPSPISFMPSNQSSGSLHNSENSFGGDLHEVEF